MDARLVTSLSPYRRVLASLLCAAALLCAPACGDDAVGTDDDAAGADDDGDDDDENDDDAEDDDADDDAPADDDVEDDDGDDDGPAIDGGPSGRNDAGRIDAGRIDAGRSDAGSASADGGFQADGGIAPLDAALGLDASSDGSAGDAKVDAQTDSGTPREDLGKGDGRDVVLMGDSWMSNTLGTGNAITGALTRLTRQRYREHARQGVEVLQYNLLFGPAIPTQWDDAVRQNRDIKTVVMSGGGNDIIQDTTLQTDCASGGARCKAKLEEIARALVALWNRMGAAGVRDVVHVLYSKNVGDVRDVEANNESLKKLCADLTAIRCHTVDTNELVRGRQDLIADGIHPTQATNDRIAKVISDLMVAEGIRR